MESRSRRTLITDPALSPVVDRRRRGDLDAADVVRDLLAFASSGALARPAKDGKDSLVIRTGVEAVAAAEDFEQPGRVLSLLGVGDVLLPVPKRGVVRAGVVAGPFVHLP